MAKKQKKTPQTHRLQHVINLGNFPTPWVQKQATILDDGYLLGTSKLRIQLSNNLLTGNRTDYFKYRCYKNQV